MTNKKLSKRRYKRSSYRKRSIARRRRQTSKRSSYRKRSISRRRRQTSKRSSYRKRSISGRRRQTSKRSSIKSNFLRNKSKKTKKMPKYARKFNNTKKLEDIYGKNDINILRKVPNDTFLNIFNYSPIYKKILLAIGLDRPDLIGYHYNDYKDKNVIYWIIWYFKDKDIVNPFPYIHKNPKNKQFNKDLNSFFPNYTSFNSDLRNSIYHFLYEYIKTGSKNINKYNKTLKRLNFILEKVSNIKFGDSLDDSEDYHSYYGEYPMQNKIALYYYLLNKENGLDVNVNNINVCKYDMEDLKLLFEPENEINYVFCDTNPRKIWVFAKGEAERERLHKKTNIEFLHEMLKNNIELRNLLKDKFYSHEENMYVDVKYYYDINTKDYERKDQIPIPKLFPDLY